MSENHAEILEEIKSRDRVKKMSGRGAADPLKSVYFEELFHFFFPVYVR
jgi:hypothetical protein